VVVATVVTVKDVVTVVTLRVGVTVDGESESSEALLRLS
jgi:hypothetical protein